MADQAVKQFDPADFQKAVADKIKGEFAAMVPDDQWKSLVKKHVDDFLNGKGDGTLHGIVTKQLTAKVEEMLKAYFGGQDWDFQWNGARNVASDKIKTIILENIPLIVHSLLTDAAQNVFSQIQQRIGQGGRW